MSRKEPRPNQQQLVGRSNQTKHAHKNTWFATKSPSEIRIAELRLALDAAAATGDLAVYKVLLAEHAQALTARNPEQTHQLNQLHLAEVERTVAMADHGLRQVPARWLKPRHNTRVALEPAESFNGLDEAEVLRSA